MDRRGFLSRLVSAGMVVFAGSLARESLSAKDLAIPSMEGGIRLAEARYKVRYTDFYDLA